jgi:hypothetical protein
MAGTKATPQQFEVLEDRIIHVPTGARFNFYPRRPEKFSTISWGRAGDVLENGDDYRPVDVRAMAEQLLRTRKQTRS